MENNISYTYSTNLGLAIRDIKNISVLKVLKTRRIDTRKGSRFYDQAVYAGRVGTPFFEDLPEDKQNAIEEFFKRMESIKYKIMMKKILIIILAGFLFIFIIVISVIDKEPDKKEIFISDKLSQIDLDSTFYFSSIVKEDFDSLYIIYPYHTYSDFSENINMKDLDKELFLRSLNDDLYQAILFTKNRKPILYTYVEANLIKFAYPDFVKGRARFSLGYSCNSHFRIVQNEFGEKEMIPIQ